MRTDYWGCREAPFGGESSTRFMFMTRGHEDALMLLHFNLTRNQGVSLLTGEIGSGKTLVCQKLVEILDPMRFFTIWLTGFNGSASQLLSRLLAELGVRNVSSDLKVLRQQLHIELLERYDAGRKVILIVDDAHAINNTETLQEIQFLLDSKVNNQFLISPLIVGVPELSKAALKVPTLYQRFAAKFELKALDSGTINELLLYRLKMAGYPEPELPFTSAALQILNELSAGLPGYATSLAERAMKQAELEKRTQVDEFLMQEIAQKTLGVNVA